MRKGHDEKNVGSRGFIMKNMFCPLLLILFLTCFSISCSGGEPKSDITPVFLRVEGTKILNAHGARVFLRGFNSGPMKFASYKDDHRNLQDIYNFNRKVYEHYLTADDFRNIREMGANVVRLHSFLKFWTLETEKGNYDDNFLQILDRIIDDATEFVNLFETVFENSLLSISFR